MTATLPRLVFSVPNELGRYGGAALGLHAFRPDQIMFGGDAQLSVFAGALERAKIVSAFLPHPEIFSHATSFEHIAHVLRAGTSDILHKLTHVRFGPAADVRVLKFARNFYVQAGHTRRDEVRVSGNLFATGRVLPASVQKVLRYERGQEKLFCLGPEIPPVGELPTEFMVDDINHWPSGKRVDRNDLRSAAQMCLTEGKLELQSFSEFASNISFTTGSEGSPLSEPPNFVQGRRQDKTSIEASIAIPYNLADAASLVPDLLRTYVKYLGPSEAGLNITVFPFNGAHRSADWTRFVREIATLAERRGDQICRSQLWIAKVKGPVPRSALAVMFPVAIVDDGDPERGWTEVRLRKLGIQVIRLGEAQPESGEQRAQDAMPRYREIEDGAGQRVVRVPTVSKIQHMEVLASAIARAHRGGSSVRALEDRQGLTCDDLLQTFGELL
ncbi:hypothetical protein [Methylobacterium durans]|uniref:Uncharacterized protein n=1 Tax=Methylobacterium durans TaxID=2202825 RepID=A0A2U8W8V0_9HYPH|nr:hypothetical protein [Methylobacterium durans]AWN41746.1 hypothetical protein DK389_16060 [Methylobacterium durans]